MVEAQGFLVDKQTRCIHYHSKLDIIALQCYDCKKYYACYWCHDSLENHIFEPYPLSLIQDKPILCGVCLKLLTYKQYKESLSVAPFVFLTLIQIAKIIRNAILNSKSSSFEVV